MNREPLAPWERELLGGFEDGPGTITVIITHTDGTKETFCNILVGIKGEPITYKDGRVEFESADSSPVLYTALNVHSIATYSE